MKKFMFVLMVLCVVGFVVAQEYSVGPYPNYNGTVDTSFIIEVPVTNEVTINDPFGGSYHVASMGGQVIEGVVTTPIFAASYVEFESENGSPFNPETGFLTLTDIWTVNMDPGAPPEMVPPLRGFESGPPPFVLTGPGFHTGKSGTDYPTGPVETVLVTDLPIRLPDYNVGMIQEGPPGGVVYLTQATVPANEFIWDPSPYFLVDSQDEWQSKLDAEWPHVHLAPMTQEEGEIYLLKLEDDWEDGTPYSPISPTPPEFMPPTLYVYEGEEGGGATPPEDAGLVMVWGDDTTPPGERAAAWKWEYGDPDLSNCIITVTATPPGPSIINRISLGMQDINGNIRSWWWNVPIPINHSVPTTIKIDTTMTGLTAATPTASGFANSAAFDLTKVASIVADENANWVGGPVPVPAPGQTIAGVWNYWHNLSVTPKLPATGANSKWYVKYSQPPVEVEDQPGQIIGWDEVSNYNNLPDPIMADDWKCEDDRPITDIHWWGSFKGWTQPHLPPILPIAFRIGIWTDVPLGADGLNYSHPGQLIWENVCTTSVWNFAGYDVDPRCEYPEYPCEENETCFQWAQFLNQDEWFRQDPMGDDGTTPNIYWLSIAPVYGPNVDYADPDFYPWGWKTRKHFFNDDAVRITDASIWPPIVGSVWTGGTPVEFPQEVSWDLAFELTTNEPKCPGLSADLNDDCIVNLPDFAIMAGEWLDTSP